MNSLPCLLSAVFLLGCTQSQESKIVLSEDSDFGEISLRILEKPVSWSPELEQLLSDKWETASVPIVIEMGRFNQRGLTRRLYDLMEEKTGKNFGTDHKKWQKWLWAQEYEPFANYPTFKSHLYRKLDPRFAEYFRTDVEATIRLDEVVWGGVRQDGIPPLHNPKMIAASQARYLADRDVVFGIEVDGDARAYPKRILAWHEMFTDTIQGVPLAGVY